jgi:hypothetical protein
VSQQNYGISVQGDVEDPAVAKDKIAGLIIVQTLLL